MYFHWCKQIIFLKLIWLVFLVYFLFITWVPKVPWTLNKLCNVLCLICCDYTLKAYFKVVGIFCFLSMSKNHPFWKCNGNFSKWIPWYIIFVDECYVYDWLCFYRIHKFPMHRSAKNYNINPFLLFFVLVINLSQTLSMRPFLYRNSDCHLIT